MDTSEHEYKIRVNHINEIKDEFCDDNYVFIVPGFAAKQFSSYCSMREDMLLIIEYLNSLEEREYSEIINSSLTYAIIALYGKCFTDATRSNSPKLEPDKIFHNKNQLFDTHEFLMELRHHFISHRGKTDSEIESTFYVLPKKGKETNVQYRRAKRISFSKEKISEIKKLIDHLISFINVKIDKRGKKIQEFMMSFKAKELGVLSINNLASD